jgi:hypothetical protein
MPRGDGKGPAGGGQGRGQGQGGGQGRMGGRGGGAGGECICSDCGCTVPHKRGVPCTNMRCPDCGKPMMRVFK